MQHHEPAFAATDLQMLEMVLDVIGHGRRTAVLEPRNASKHEIGESQSRDLPIDVPVAARTCVRQEVHRPVRDVCSEAKLMVTAHQREVVAHLVRVRIEPARGCGSR